MTVGTRTRHPITLLVVLFCHSTFIKELKGLPQIPLSYKVSHHRLNTPWYSKKLADSPFSTSDLFVMLNLMNSLVSRLDAHINSIHTQREISLDSKLQLEVVKVFKRELKATGKSLVTVLQDLNQTLSSDYHSLEKIKQSCHLRLRDMREAAAYVEEDYNTILELEREMKSLHPNSSVQSYYHVLNEILKDISNAADDLETMQEHLFSDSRKAQGAKIETVVKLMKERDYEHSILHMQFSHDPKKDSQEKTHQLQQSSHQEQELEVGMSILIDSADNQYILSHPRDVTIPIEDHRLVHDIVFLLLLSFLFGGLCSLFRVPSSFSYMLAGTVLGPNGCNWIESVVQVETVGEFGVMFIVFFVGLEFTPEKLRKVSEAIP